MNHYKVQVTYYMGDILDMPSFDVWAYDEEEAKDNALNEMSDWSYDRIEAIEVLEDEEYEY